MSDLGPGHGYIAPSALSITGATDGSGMQASFPNFQRPDNDTIANYVFLYAHEHVNKLTTVNSVNEHFGIQMTGEELKAILRPHWYETAHHPFLRSIVRQREQEAQAAHKELQQIGLRYPLWFIRAQYSEACVSEKELEERTKKTVVEGVKEAFSQLPSTGFPYTFDAFGQITS